MALINDKVLERFMTKMQENSSEMKFIELHIKCHNDSDRTAELREMGIDTPSETEYRKLTLRAEHIVGFYPNTEDGCFVFVANGDELTVKESYQQLIERIINDS